MAKTKRDHEAGYTLIELLVVLAILALLATVATTQYLKYLEHAKEQTAHTQIEALSSALDLYKLDMGGYPSSQQGLAALKIAPGGTTNWNGPYIKKTTALNDPWGHPYTYASPGQHGDFDLSSNGPSGESSNGGDPPIRNW